VGSLTESAALRGVRGRLTTASRRKPCAFGKLGPEMNHVGQCCDCCGVRSVRLVPQSSRALNLGFSVRRTMSLPVSAISIRKYWIPACAGMTEKKNSDFFQPTNIGATAVESAAKPPYKKMREADFFIWGE
jgi:hypothetical protein